MADTNPDTPAVPVTVNRSPYDAQIATAMRDIGILFGFMTAILGFLGKHDLTGLLDFIRSSEALPALGLIVGAGVFAYRQWLARRQRATTVLAATSEPNTNVIVKG